MCTFTIIRAHTYGSTLVCVWVGGVGVWISCCVLAHNTGDLSLKRLKIVRRVVQNLIKICLMQLLWQIYISSFCHQSVVAMIPEYIECFFIQTGCQFHMTFSRAYSWQVFHCKSIAWFWTEPHQVRPCIIADAVVYGNVTRYNALSLTFERPMAYFNEKIKPSLSKTDIYCDGPIRYPHGSGTCMQWC